jgi:hypothetical protein
MTVTPPEIVLHINLEDLSNWRQHKRLAFFDRVACLCETYHLPYRVVSRHPDLTRSCRGASDGRLHLVEDGRVQGAGWLNAAVAYLLGFWHLDPSGVLADSSARFDRYTPRSVDWDSANAYFKALRQRFVTPRLSRYNPPRTRDAALPQGSIAVFLQGRTPYKAGQCDVPMHEIIVAACQQANGRAVVVKPHPLSIIDCARAMAQAADAGARFSVFEGNIHDLLASCAVTVSVNSAAAMEGFLHRKPAILFGRSDFESLVTRVTQPEGFGRGLHEALSTERRYAKMMYWYFTRHCLDTDADDFESRLFVGFDKVGFGRARFGVEP